MISKIWPSRQDAKRKQGRTPVMVSDLDAMISQPVSFKVLGKVHTIEPLTVEQFTRFAFTYSKIISLQDQEHVSPDELIEAYFEMVSSVCNTISRENIKRMSQQQVAGLFQIMVDLHTGRLFSEEGEKKTLEKVSSLLNMRPPQS